MRREHPSVSYDRQIRLRGRPWFQPARRVSLGYELDPAENDGFRLIIPTYLVVEEVPRPVAQPPAGLSGASPGPHRIPAHSGLHHGA